MAKISREKLVEAVETIMDYCNGISCKHCVFGKDFEEECGLKKCIPNNWDIPNVLDPCPHCGKEVAELHTADNGEDMNVICNWNKGGCGAQGGYRRTKEEAIEAWNWRV